MAELADLTGADVWERGLIVTCDACAEVIVNGEDYDADAVAAVLRYQSDKPGMLAVAGSIWQNFGECATCDASLSPDEYMAFEQAPMPIQVL